MNRRAFIFALVGLPFVAAAEPLKLTILNSDADRFRHEEALRELMLLDLKEMDVHRHLGLNLERVRGEDNLYAKIQADRKW